MDEVKKRCGWVDEKSALYVGGVTIYSYLQAVGLVNDHETGCFRYNAVEAQ